MSPLPTIVFFNAEWCSHCQTFKKTFKYLAKKLKDTEIKLCEIDGEKNEIQGIEVDKWPMILLYKEVGEKQEAPEVFSAQPNLESMISWINQFLPQLGIEITKQDLLVESMLHIEDVDDETIEEAKREANKIKQDL